MFRRELGFLCGCVATAAIQQGCQALLLSVLSVVLWLVESGVPS